MESVEYLATAGVNVLGGVFIGQALDNWVPPVVDTATGSLVGKGDMRDGLEVLAQFSLSMLAAKSIMTMILPGVSWYEMPISDGLFYSTLLYAQPNMRKKAWRLVERARAALLPLPHLKE